MADPVIVPPTPVINQGDTPEEIARVGENIQKIFDKVAPKMKGSATPEPPAAPSPTPPESKVTAAPTEPPKESPAPETAEPPPKTSEPSRIPSFIEEALRVETGQSVASATQPPAVVDELPEEPPIFKTPEESKQNWRQFREKYNALKKEAETLKNRPAVDPQINEKLTYLENLTKQQQVQLAQAGVERHQEFQAKIVAPMNAAWQEAARVVQESGGNPQDLAKALSLSGRAHFEALDEIFSGLPETAKLEATEAVRNYRRLDDQRRKALADAPRTAQELHKADLQRQYQQVEQQRGEMQRLWEEAGRKLREEAKVEVLLKSSDPDAKWWNEQADQLEETSRRLFLENTDMGKVAIAMRLAPMVDVYRKLWLATRAELGKKEQVIKDKFGSEPNISESGGNVRGNSGSMEEQLKRPFTDVFLEEFHRQRAQGR